VAYIRRSSRSRNDPGDLSREFQVAEVQRLAGADVDRLDVRAQDWGRSASTDKTDRRLAFLSILDEVERGDVSALYAYSTDRIARSVEWSARLLNACRRAGVPIITSEGRFDPDNAMTDQLFYFQAMQNEGYSRQASQKRRATVERQRARGARLGIAPYGAMPGEDLAHIVAAYYKAGSCYGAARILNQAGSRTRRGAMWSSKVVGDVLRREGVAYRRKPHPGAKDAAEWITFRLLTCPCGSTMTSMDKRSPRVTCYKSRHDTNHPKPFGISEAKLLPALMTEASRLHIPYNSAELAAIDSAKRDALEAKRAQVIDYGIDHLIPKADVASRLAAIDDELDALDAASTVVDIPKAVDWTWAPRDINRVLRAIWSEVLLGPDLLPVKFEWRVPAWRG
jgi:DNA invertase Pin-like site-specific DNA recombinase